MSAIEQDHPIVTLTRAHVRLLVLVAVLLIVIGFALGFKWVTVREVAAVLAAQQPAPAPASNEPAYYDVPEAAAHLKVSVSQIYRAVREGQIKRTPIGRGREYRISREALREYAQRQQESAA